MKIEINNLLYDESDDRCFLITSMACGKLYAFIQVIDLGSGGVKRYWGPYTHIPETQELMLTEIMASGGKWPDLPGKTEA